MFHLSVEMGGIQVAGDCRSPALCAAVNLGSVLLSGISAHFMK